VEPNEAIRKIQQMSIGEKIAALTPTDKAYVQGYIERAFLGNCIKKERNNREKTKQNG